MKDTEARESSPGQQLECKRKRIKILERTRATINDKKKKKKTEQERPPTNHPQDYGQRTGLVAF